MSLSRRLADIRTTGSVVTSRLTGLRALGARSMRGRPIFLVSIQSLSLLNFIAVDADKIAHLVDQQV